MPEIVDNRRGTQNVQIINYGKQPWIFETPKIGDRPRVTVELGSIEDRGIVGRQQPDAVVDAEVWDLLRGPIGTPAGKLTGAQRIVRGLLDARTISEHRL